MSAMCPKDRRTAPRRRGIFAEPLHNEEIEAACPTTLSTQLAIRGQPAREDWAAIVARGHLPSLLLWPVRSTACTESFRSKYPKDGRSAPSPRRHPPIKLSNCQ